MLGTVLGNVSKVPTSCFWAHRDGFLLPGGPTTKNCRTLPAEFRCLVPVATERHIAHSTARLVQVTSPTELTDGQIELETVGDKGRIHPPPGIIHKDGNLEDDNLEVAC